MPRDTEISAAKVDSWAEDNLVPIVAEYLWEDALEAAAENAVEDGSIKREERQDFIGTYQASGSINGAFKDARQIIRAVAQYYSMPIREVAEKVGSGDEFEIDPDEFGYYLAMQSLGHGVDWTDNHDEELWTPQWDAAMWYSVEDAWEALEDFAN